MTQSTTADTLLDVAQALVQQRGFNDFSFRDLADAVGIKSASIHYHFPTKTDLGVALVQRYRASMSEVVAKLAAEGLSPRDELSGYMGLLAAAIDRGQKRCVCGVLGAELSTLAAPLRKEVTAFFVDNETYLAKLLSRGVAAGDFVLSGSHATASKAIFAMLQGGMLSACVFGQIERFTAVAEFVGSSLDRSTQ